MRFLPFRSADASLICGTNLDTGLNVCTATKRGVAETVTPLLFLWRSGEDYVHRALTHKEGNVLLKNFYPVLIRVHLYLPFTERLLFLIFF